MTYRKLLVMYHKIHHLYIIRLGRQHTIDYNLIILEIFHNRKILKRQQQYTHAYTDMINILSEVDMQWNETFI